jgi:hypothetical protein
MRFISRVLSLRATLSWVVLALMLSPFAARLDQYTSNAGDLPSGCCKRSLRPAMQRWRCWSSRGFRLAPMQMPAVQKCDVCWHP